MARVKVITAGEKLAFQRSIESGAAMPNLIRFGRAICGDLNQAERRDGGSRTGEAVMPPARSPAV